MPLIVIAEDERSIRELLVEIFEEQGHQVKAFPCADDAWEFLASCDGQVQMVLTDFSMPGDIDGIFLAHLIRDRFPDLPIIISSGFLEETSDFEGLNVAVIPKPWTVSQLLAICAAMIPEKTPQTDIRQA
ncbi:response regulator [Pseudomonas daroniae]|uniref:Response regulator n=2 Tax=Pseudomonadales TaxID=72274 RepID=A0A4Q9QQK2_9GAMM|nr:response regulator [Pseudomonas daroniae]TBU82901.1 response regulator [Pseudomonas daroniae]TBU85899.1 response regulator [Pseudomonas sp. FRB 228]TBU95062.1 response regulator [Pseudomonas daroniae]